MTTCVTVVYSIVLEGTGKSLDLHKISMTIILNFSARLHGRCPAAVFAYCMQVSRRGHVCFAERRPRVSHSHGVD